jgi:predicted dehydrogenase
MQTRNLLVMFTAAALLLTCCSKSDVIKTKVPVRPAGQEDVIGLRTEPIDTVRIGIVGLGMRGSFAVYRYTNVPWTRIAAICDVEPDRVESSRKYLLDNGFPDPAVYSGEEGYKQLCEREDIDLVYICTDWVNHTPIALYAMEHGKHAAIEVPAATSLQECWALVNASERTRRHCMMLENCCYDFF